MCIVVKELIILAVLAIATQQSQFVPLEHISSIRYVSFYVLLSFCIGILSGCWHLLETHMIIFILNRMKDMRVTV